MGIVAVFLVDHYLTVKLPGVFIAIPENNAKIQRCRARIARNRFEGVPGYDENL